MTDIESAIEAILFVSGEAVPITKIAYALEKDIKATKKILDDMISKYNSEKRGLKIIEINKSYQICTNPKYFEYIKKLYPNEQKQSLSQALLETLAIIAYKQPITKAQIEQIRGVNSDHAVNKLVEKKLIKSVGKMDGSGKAVLFGTTDEFLHHFGFKSIKALPRISKA